jgi:thiopeptide-type bacteriocin biosynthesis protein
VEERAGHRWLTAQLFYHGSLDLLLCELVLPLVRELRDGGLLERYFFLRYWLGGPHVRLRLLPVDGAGADVRAAVVRDCDRFFATRPAPDGLTPDAYERLARNLARAEPDAETLALQPNNSVQFTDYRPERHKYGTGPALAAVERHFEQSSDLALDVVQSRTPMRRRQLLALAALLGGAETAGAADVLDRGARAWGELVGVPEDRYANVLQTYRERRDQLRTVALRVRQPGATGDTFVDRWRASVAGLWSVLAELERSGQFRPNGVVADGLAATAFAVENCRHMFCNRLGIGLSEEWFLRSLAAQVAVDLRDEPRLVGR